MARNPATAGALVASDVEAAVISAGIVAGTPVTNTQMQAFWTAVATGLFTHDASNAVVEPGSFNAPSSGGTVTGLGGPIN